LSSDSTIFGGADSVTCGSDAAALATMLTGTNTPLQDNDPYDSGPAAVAACATGGTDPCDPAGNTIITGTAADATTGKSTMTFVTQFGKVAADTLTNTLDIE